MHGLKEGPCLDPQGFTSTSRHSASGRWNGRVLQKEFDKPVGPLNIITASQPQSVDKHVMFILKSSTKMEIGTDKIFQLLPLVDRLPPDQSKGLI